MQQQNASSALMPSTMRPVPLRCRDDLVVQQVIYQGIASPVIKDPVGLNYFRLQPEQYSLLKLLNGQRSLEELREHLQASFPTTPVTVTDVQSLITDLHEKGLLLSERLRQGETSLKRRQENRLRKIRQTLLNPLFIRFPGWDPDAVLTRLNPWTGWIFTPPALICGVLLIITSWLFVGVRFDEIRQRLPEFQQFFGWPNLIFLWLTMSLTKILHEFGHGLSCKYYGGECHSMGVVMMIFSPTLYCDVTDSWMLKNKWKRILIGAAGMYIEMILAALAILIWYNTSPGLIQHMALNVFFISTVTTVVFNANPLLRYDGYYMLADFLEIPNLNEKSTQALSRSFSWWVLGVEQPADPFMPTSGRGWFILFIIASTIYRWFIMLGITLFLYTVLKPYRLQSLGITVAVVSLLAAVGNLGWSLIKMMLAPRRDPVSRLKLAVILLGLAGTIVAVLLIPFPWYEQAPFSVEPAGAQHVYAFVPGIVEEIAVKPGDRVHRGQLLLQMHSPELLDQRDQLVVERAAQQVEVNLYREQKDPEGQHLAEQRLLSLNHQINDLETQLEQLRLVAPVAGRVIASPRVPQPDAELHPRQLPRWHGTPLESRNLGETLDAGTQVCSIAPEQKLEAILLIDQSDRGDLQVGDPIRLKFDSIPGKVFNGIVREFSSRHLEYAPSVLSSKYGGPLPTVTNSQGEERLSDAVFQAKVEFDNPESLSLSGLRGQGRFIVSKRTISNWLWRAFRKTFHFRL